MSTITKASQDAQNISNLRQLLIDAGRSISWQCFGECRAFDEFATGPVRDPGAVIEDIRAALQGKAAEVTVAIDSLYNERRDGMTNAIFPPVQIGTRLFSAQPAPVVPDGFALVPVEFVRGFCTLAHNYQLKAEAPSYYRGIEADAFSAAYRRCGEDLAKVRAMLAASQQKGGQHG